MQFAIVYLDEPDLLYEFTFNINDVELNPKLSLWDGIREYCITNKDSWTSKYIPDCVVIVDEKGDYENNNGPVKSADTAYFNSWLKNKYGNEYIGNYIMSLTRNGLTMYLKSGFQVYTSLSRSFYISITITVVSFITGVLGLVASVNLVSVLSFIAGAGGLFEATKTVHSYSLRANWFRYATCVSGTGYPYGLADKFTYFDGYSYTGTGTRNVDVASQSTTYIPSSTVFNSNTRILDAAFEEYDEIGFQNGSF